MKSNTIVKLLAVMLAVVMLFSLAMNVLAEDLPGKITIEETVEGKTYDLFMLFELTYSGDHVAYTIAEDWEDFFNGDGAGYIVDENNAEETLNPIVVDGKLKYMNITESNVADLAQDALKYAVDLSPVKAVIGDGDDVLVDQLELGYYLVYPQGATIIKDTYASICSLTSAKPTGTVSIKATFPTFTKIADERNVEYGEQVYYTIIGDVPDTTGFKTYTYTVHDQMCDGLTLCEEESFQVSFGTYLGYGKMADDYDIVIEDNGFSITFDMTKYQEYVGKQVIIGYWAAVNKNAVIGAEGNPNEAYLTYSNNPLTDTTEDSEKISVKVYTCGITIDKFDDKDHEKKLQGAKFVLARKELVRSQYPSSYEYYSIDEDGVVSWTLSIDEATVVTTDENGWAEFKGIEEGTYYLIEVEAPEGYNPLTEPVEVTVTTENQTADAYQVAEVANNSGVELPSTGGIGTDIFYIFGSVAMIAAVVLLVTKKKASCKD